MMLNKLVTRVAGVLCVSVMFGCASVDTAPVADDVAAKKFEPNPSTSQVYVYRDQTFGSAVAMPVAVDGKVAGTTGPKSYFKFDLPEGKHTISSQKDKSVLTIETKNGEIYFVWQQVKMGALSAGSELQLVDEEKGKAGVKQSKLIQSKF